MRGGGKGEDLVTGLGGTGYTPGLLEGGTGDRAEALEAERIRLSVGQGVDGSTGLSGEVARGEKSRGRCTNVGGST